MGIQQERKNIDGIKPVAPKAKRYQWTTPSTAAKAVAKPKPRTLASVKPQAPSIPRPQPMSTATTKPQPKPRATPMQRSKPARSSRNWLLVLHIVVASIAFAGLCFFSEKAESTGQLLILTYAIYALMLRVPSRITFMLVLASFAAVILHLTLRPDTALVNTFSIYAFLLLIVSAISLGKEGRRQVRFE